MTGPPRARRGRHATTASPELSTLTSRERETLALLARGMTSAEIAAELFVSETTVKTRVGRALQKSISVTESTRSFSPTAMA